MRVVINRNLFFGLIELSRELGGEKECGGYFFARLEEESDSEFDLGEEEPRYYAVIDSWRQFYFPTQEVLNTRVEFDEMKLGKEVWRYFDKTKHHLVWWHSHVRMGTTPSGQDLNSCEELIRSGNDMTMLITNYDAKYTSEYHFMHRGECYSKEDTVELTENKALMPKAAAIIKMREKITAKKYPVSNHSPIAQSEGRRVYWLNGVRYERKYDPYLGTWVDTPVEDYSKSLKGEAKERTREYNSVTKQWEWADYTDDTDSYPIYTDEGDVPMHLKEAGGNYPDLSDQEFEEDEDWDLICKKVLDKKGGPDVAK